MLQAQPAERPDCTTIMEEIKETHLHGTIYCGIPSSLDAFKVANKVLKEMGKVSAKPTK